MRPIIAEKFPILQAAKVNELLEGGQVVGNIVLLAYNIRKHAESHQTSSAKGAPEQ